MSLVKSSVDISRASLLEPRTSAKSIDKSTSPPRISSFGAALGQAFAWVTKPRKQRPQIFGFFSHGVNPYRLRIRAPGAPNGALQSLHRGFDGMNRSGLGSFRCGCVPLRKSCHSSSGVAYSAIDGSSLASGEVRPPQWAVPGEGDLAESGGPQSEVALLGDAGGLPRRPPVGLARLVRVA